MRSKTEVPGARPVRSHAGIKGAPTKESQTQVSTRPIKTDANGFVRCRVCGCTEIDACAPSCSWVEGDLCSVCGEAVAAMVQWFHDSRHPNFAALKREYERQAFNTPIPYTVTKKWLNAAGGAR